MPKSILDYIAKVPTAKIYDGAVTEDKLNESVIPNINTNNLRSTAFLHIQDQKDPGVDGGTFTSGEWRTRDLNTIVYNTIEGASLSNNIISLPASQYYIEVSAPAYRIRFVRAAIQNNTTQELLALSNTVHVSSAYGEFGSNYINTMLNLSAATDLSIVQRCTATYSITGFGWASNMGFNEIYTDVKIWRVGD